MKNDEGLHAAMATWSALREELPGVRRQPDSDVFGFLASLAGSLPPPHIGADIPAKLAVASFTEVLYHETRGRGVRVVCVCPPPVATPLLDQAKSNPKILAELPPIPPEVVLDAIEAGLEAGKLWVFPGRGTAFVWRMRRFLPGLMWRRVHRIEGL